MQRLTIQTIKPREVVDITDLVNQEIKNNNLVNGFCILQAKHTTAALTTADLDPGTDLDMLDAYEAMVPKLHFRHPHDPKHAWSHIISSMIGTTLNLLVKDGVLDLGKWQRVVLIELDGPRDREVDALWLSV